jgi:hypothetical protein
LYANNIFMLATKESQGLFPVSWISTKYVNMAFL